MGLLQLTDFSGGYATDLDSEQMANNELLTATNVQWRDSGLIKRKGTNQYASLTAHDDVLGMARVYLNDTWIHLVAVEAASAVKIYQGATTTYAEITDEGSAAYTLTAAKKVYFSEAIGGAVIAVNGTDRATVIYHNGSKFVAQELDRYDERIRADADWEAGQYKGGLPFYAQDTADAQNDTAADFLIGTTITNEGHYIASGFTFTKISYTGVSGGGGAGPLAAYRYWNGTAFVPLTTFQQTPTWGGGDTVCEFDLPLDSDGVLLWKTYDKGDEAALDAKFVIQVRFIIVPLADLFCTEIANISHTHYLTMLLQDERPQCVAIHGNRPILGVGNTMQRGKLNTVKSWEVEYVEYAVAGGAEIRWMVTHQDYLAIIKEGAIYGAYGSSFDTWTFKQIASIGTASGASVAVVKDHLLFLGNDGDIYVWNGMHHSAVTAHLSTELAGLTHENAVATIWQGEYWLAFPTESVVLVADPDSFRIPENSNGEGRLSFYKFTSFPVDYWVNVEGAGELTKMLLVTDRGDNKIVRRVDNGDTDQGTAAITATMKTKEFSDSLQGVMKRVGRVKPKIASGNGNHTMTIGNDRGDTAAFTITSSTDYATPNYDVDGEGIYIQVVHNSTSTCKVIGFAMALVPRRF